MLNTCVYLLIATAIYLILLIQRVRYSQGLPVELSLGKIKHYVRQQWQRAGWGSYEKTLLMAIVFIGFLAAGWLASIFLTYRIMGDKMHVVMFFIVGNIPNMAAWATLFCIKNIAIRQNELRVMKEVSYTLNLMIIYLHAGYPIEYIMDRLSMLLSHFKFTIAEPLRLLCEDLKYHDNRQQTWQKLIDRIGFQDAMFFARIMQANGVFDPNTIKHLTTQKDILHQLRLSKLQDYAGKTTVISLLPLILFLFPAFLLCILGPIIVQFANLFYY